MSKQKGDAYEVQIFHYLTKNYLEYQIFMWRDVPHKYIIKYVLYDVNELNYDKPNDSGCDILMVNKSNEEDFIIVQCKNYKNKKVCFEDLPEFLHLIALSHIPVKGFIISNTPPSEILQRKFNLVNQVKFFNIKYRKSYNLYDSYNSINE